MSGKKSESDYSFMRSGTVMDTGTDEELVLAIQAMVLVFLEDATRMAVSYTQGKYPRTTVISGGTIIKCLKARAQFGIQLNDQYRERMEAIIQRTGECSNNDHRIDAHFSSFFREVEEEREKNEAKGEAHQAAINIIVQTVDRLEPQFNDWQPTDRFQSLLKDAIANVSREMD